MAFWGPEVEWHERDVVVPAFRQWLEAQGWVTETETEFVDVVAHRGNETIYAEVKGRTNSRPGAMAAALPLRGLDAWRVYFGLPLSGSRLPAGGLEAFFALGYEDAVMKLYGPTVQQAVDEFPTAFAELRRQHGLADGPTAVVGASIGAFVALSVAASNEPTVSAIALVSPACVWRASSAPTNDSSGSHTHGATIRVRSRRTSTSWRAPQNWRATARRRCSS
jgi:pimeloyl-ACP methyl ester carboxylesterase